MTLSRRNWFGWATAGALAPLGLLARRAFAQDHGQHMEQAQAEAASAAGKVAPETTYPAQPIDAAARGNYTPVRTLNGWTLPPRLVDGVKEFHLVAEEVEHEFAPGCVAKCWGYNGTTPGPTIEAVEGDRVRLYVTNKLPEHTSMHWHGQ